MFSLCENGGGEKRVDVILTFFRALSGVKAAEEALKVFDERKAQNDAT